MILLLRLLLLCSQQVLCILSHRFLEQVIVLLLLKLRTHRIRDHWLRNLRHSWIVSVEFHHIIIDCVWPTLACLMLINTLGGQRGAHIESHWRDSLKIVFGRSGQVHRETVLLVSRGLLVDRVRTNLLLLVHMRMVRSLGCLETTAVAHIQLTFA